ncbi:hypothetical protein [Salinigranum halophilum]|uniref:hypothetical protein n=1 Tax=Salinigranum halophilum TaxID=2565931 RepID=UPI0010A947C6|nr:hypothetical protein [Salinigranum halophilum]
MPEIEIQFASPEEYELLRTIRDKYGVLWRGMLIQGATRLEGAHLPRGLSPLHERETESRAIERQPAESISHVTEFVADETKSTTTQKRPSVDKDQSSAPVDHGETSSSEDGPREFNLSTSRSHERDLASNYGNIDTASDPGHRWVLERS